MASTMSDYRLSDRYTEAEGRVFMSGIQALARIPIEQLRVDRAAGRNTAAFISGYPGSPLGGYDQEIARAIREVPDLPIVARPGVNEEYGATAVMGSQLASEQPDATYDGVVGIWYGKAPGLDRSGDALRHAVFAGTSRYGGAVALVGDDPAAKSSTLPSSSDATLVDLHMPILYPGDVQEALDLGRHAVALSRACGLWSAMKIVAQVADATGTVDLSTERITPVIPEHLIDGEPWVTHADGFLLTPHTLDVERDFREIRLPLAVRYAVENRLNRVTVDAPDAWLGLIATGYTYHELRQALRRLGLPGVDELRDAGIRMLEMRMPVPFHPQTIQRFAAGLEEILVVEEKNPTLEWLVKDALYATTSRPAVLGKTDADGEQIMPSHGILDADAMLPGLRARLAGRLEARLAPLPEPKRERALIPLSVSRKPYFCSGCPHNWSTKVNDDALVGAGIGCHGMVLLMDEEKVGTSAGITAMGAEGTQWIGMSPFVSRRHFIQNLGDGTFFHSGQLAIQAAVAAGVNMTYKLLFNGTVAMTGGQDAPGGVDVPEVAQILLAHGVAQVLITTDDVRDYRGVDLPDGVEVWDRTRMLEAQERLAGVGGVTVLIHEQACAAQSRRLRKRGQLETPARRVVINHRICEGCGDCGEVSNCLSVQPLDTPLGRKTKIDQSSCNLDYSCLHGDCPSFMTIEPADPKQRKRRFGGRRSATTAIDGPLPHPELVVDDERLAIRLAGIGGTGVVTVAQVLGTAAMLDGWDVRGLDQTGLSQKAGPVISDLRLARTDPSSSNLLGAGEADVIIAFDMLAGAADSTLKAADAGRTVVVGSTSETPTGSMIGHPEVDYPETAALIARFDAVSRAQHNRWLNAGGLTRRLFGDAATANVLMVGAAYQAGCLPVSSDAIERAIDLNGVAVDANLAAFEWGRRWITDPDAVADAAGLDAEPGLVPVDVHVPDLPTPLQPVVARLDERTGLGELLTMLAADLADYQDAAYAAAFLADVTRTADAELAVAPASSLLTETVARNLHRLLAYKDEYEVARLLLGPEGAAAAEAIGGKDATVSWQLHPPMLRALGMNKKLSVGRWGRPTMRALAKGKRLRGTAADPFGRSQLRRLERDLPVEYGRVIDTLLDGLTADRLGDAVAIAALPDQVRGYEDLKLRRIGEYRAELAAALQAWAR